MKWPSGAVVRRLATVKRGRWPLKFVDERAENSSPGNCVMVRFACCLLLAASLFHLAGPAYAVDITDDGKRLAKELDKMDVERHWLPTKYVNWETGESLKKEVSPGKDFNHSAEFVAAACKKLFVYILPPSKRIQGDLANAQFDWLEKEGKREGWKPVKNALEAHNHANRGHLVVAAFRGKGNKPGHIAIIRPSENSIGDVEKTGPQIIQAGPKNYNNTPLSVGFEHEPSAWKGKKVRYFMHRLY